MKLFRLPKPLFLTVTATLTATTLTVVALAQINPSSIPTRFGSLTIDKAHLLKFRGQLVRPKVEGNNGLTFIRKFELFNA